MAPRIVKARFRQEERQTSLAASEASRDGARNIMVALDESEYANAAFAYTLEHLYRKGDTLHLVHCVPSLPSEHVLGLPDGRLIFSRIASGDANTLKPFEEQLAHTRVESIERIYGKRLRDSHVPFQIHIMMEPGAMFKTSIGQLMCEEAQHLHAAAVVVASQSHGGLAEFLRGSVANYLTHHCERPVAVLHPPKAPASSSSARSKGAAKASATAPKTAAPGGSRGGQQQQQQQQTGRNIMVAIGGTDDGVEAVRWAAQEMYRPGDNIHLVHVVPCLPPAWFQGVDIDPLTLGSSLSIASLPASLALGEEVQEEMRREVEGWKEKQALRYSWLMDELGVNYTFDIVAEFTNASALLWGTEADPVLSIAGDICSTAESLNAAAVVMASHPRSALMEFLLGSVCNEVAHHCTRPVIVLHHRKPSSGGGKSGSTGYSSSMSEIESDSS